MTSPKRVLDAKMPAPQPKRRCFASHDPFTVLPADILARAASYVSKAAYAELRDKMATKLQAYFRMVRDHSRYSYGLAYSKKHDRPFHMARMYSMTLSRAIMWNRTEFVFLGFWGKRTRWFSAEIAADVRRSHYTQRRNGRRAREVHTFYRADVTMQVFM